MWKEAAYGRKTSLEFFRDLGYQEEIELIEKEYLDTIEIDEDFLETVKYLKERYKLVLLSNDISQWSIYLRDKYNLNEYFDIVVISGDHGILKPDIKLFQYILEKTGSQASDCYFVDDREKNLAAAELLGIKTILFNRRGVVYEGIIVNNFIELKQYICESHSD